MNYTLYNEDCMTALNKIEDNSIQCIVTSPPYNKKYWNKNKPSNQVWKGFKIDYNTYEDNLPIEVYENWMIEFINLCLQKLKPHGSLFFNHKPIRHDNQVYFPLQFILRSNAKVYQEIIWDRNGSPNIRKDQLFPNTERIYWLCKDKPISYKDNLPKEFQSEVWKMSAKPNKLHPAPFPIELPLNCISLTTQPNDLVCDPFLGSGTTALACKQLGRDFIGMEMDTHYMDIVKQLLEQ